MFIALFIQLFCVKHSFVFYSLVYSFIYLTVFAYTNQVKLNVNFS